MTIISHRYRFIFIKTRKTAGTSVEMWFAPRLGPRDIMFTAEDAEPLARPFFTTLNRTTTHPTLERMIKLRLKKWFNFTSFRVHQHMTAKEILTVVGKEVWNSYTKVCVERDPWDRFISYWRFVEYMEKRDISLDYLLDLIEKNETGGLNWNISWWSNWPMYTIDDQVAVDHILRYENLESVLHEFCRSLGIPVFGDLPRAKSGIRRTEDLVSTLTPRQCHRIGNLLRREVDYFGYEWPPQMTEA